MLSENTDTASENENNANTSINEPAIEKVKENVTLIFLPESLSVLENKSKDQIQNGSKIMAIDTSSSVLGSSAQITLIDSLQNSDTENKPSAITNEVPIENTNTSNENSIGESLAESDESNVSSVLADESDDNTIQGNTPYDDEDSLGNFEYEKKVEPQYKLQIGVFSQFRNTYKLVNELKEKFPEPVIVLNDSKDDKLIYRVFLGEFNTKEEAEDFQRMIKRKFKIESVVK
jgi:cell division septation protein DedD